MEACVNTDRTVPACEFDGVVLRIRTLHEQIRIRWEPEPLAEKRAPGSGRWCVCFPEFRILHPRGTSDLDEPYALDLCTGVTSPAAAQQLEAAMSAFRKQLPETIVRVVEPFVSHQWPMMVLLHGCPHAVDLALSNPVLAFCLANSAQFRGTRPSAAAVQALWMCHRKQRAILKWLGFPDSEALVRLFRKIPPGSASPSLLRMFRSGVTADKEVLESLSHLPRINTAVLALLWNERVFEVITPKLLREVASEEQAPAGFSASSAILESLDLVAKMSPDKRVPPFSSLAQIRRFRENTDAEYRLHLRRKEEAARAARRAAEDARRLMATRGSEDDQRLAQRPFPQPPIPGTENIRPITGLDLLQAEGKEQHNCVSSYWREIITGHTSVYRITAPERATLSLVRGRDGLWRLSQLRAANNHSVRPETVKAVDKWLHEYATRGPG
jgi:hypothetical protein